VTRVSLLTISGSLRARSINREVLLAVAHLAPAGVAVTSYAGLGELPHFNPDLEADGRALPPAVRAFRDLVGQADAVVICSPEYAHGVPGSLKNGLDWLVSGPEIVHKPIGLLNASPRSTHAQASLAETLRTMSTVLVDGASPALPVNGRKLSAGEIVALPELADPLHRAIAALVDAVPAYLQWRSSLTPIDSAPSTKG